MTAAADPRPARVRVPGMAIAALLLLVIGVLTVAPTVSTYFAQQRRIADTEARITAQRADLADLKAQRARWDDPSYVRAQAGSRLFYVMPGTTAYRVIHGTATRDTGSAASAPARSTAWTDVLLDSLVSAGTTDAPAGR